MSFQVYDPEEQPEGWGEYLIRNALKTPAKVAESVGSGFGLTDLASRLNQSLGQAILGEEAYSQLKPALQARQFPTSQDINRTLQQGGNQLLGEGVGDYLTQTQPGDEPIEFLQSLIGPGAASGAFKGLGSLRTAPQGLRNLGRFAKGVAGVEAGAALGNYAGETLGLPEPAQTALGLAGGLAGGHYAGRIGQGSTANQLKRRGFELEQQKLPQEIEALEQSRKQNYDLASKLSKNVIEEAPDILEGINNIANATTKGVEAADQARILKMLGQVEDSILNGTFSLDDAKLFKRNINESRFGKSLPPTVDKYFGDINRTLNSFIKRVGEKHPVHGRVYQTAEEQTKKLADLKNLQQETHKSYEDFLRSENKKDSLDRAVEFIKPHLTESALSGLVKYITGSAPAAIVAKLGLQTARAATTQGREIYNLIKKHPELKNDFKDIVKAAQKGNSKALINAVTRYARDHNEVE